MFKVIRVTISNTLPRQEKWRGHIGCLNDPTPGYTGEQPGGFTDWV
jgi:hypothetical protein